MVTRKCQWCGFEMAEVMSREGEHLPTTVVVCEKCDLMPEMVQPMEEKERMAHQKEVSNWIMKRKT